MKSTVKLGIFRRHGSAHVALEFDDGVPDERAEERIKAIQSLLATSENVARELGAARDHLVAERAELFAIIDDAHAALDRARVAPMTNVRSSLVARVSSALSRAAVSTPPLVNGRPSCCHVANGATKTLRLGSVRGWLVGDIGLEATYCPFCGARLPKVAR